MRGRDYFLSSVRATHRKACSLGRRASAFPFSFAKKVTECSFLGTIILRGTDYSLAQNRATSKRGRIGKAAISTEVTVHSAE